jgi:putative methyltransferase (TIGR04325 family)
MRAIVRDWLPPRILQWRNQKRSHFDGNYLTWQDAASQCGGYDNHAILTKVLAATLKVKAGEAAFERDSVLFDQIQYTWPIAAGLMWAAAVNGGHLNVLDFGGSLGSSYFQYRHFLKSLPTVSWNIVEQPHYVEVGQQYIQDNQLKFYPDIETYGITNSPNIVLFSSVLQYLPNVKEIITKILTLKPRYMIIDRTPFREQEGNLIVRQTVPPEIYTASYPMWIFDQQSFFESLGLNWRIIALTDSPEGTVYTHEGTTFSFMGAILECC